MSATQVRIDVDADGHLTVVVNDHEWTPPAPGDAPPEVRLGRSDVPWVLDQLLSEHGGPLYVRLLASGRLFTDVVTRDKLAYLTQPTDRADRPPGRTPTPADVPPRRSGAPGTASAGWFHAEGYAPGEQVAMAVIVTRLTADEHGRIGFTLPAALQAMVGDVIAIGEESREIAVNQADHQPSLRAIRDALSPRPARNAAGVDDLNVGFRRQAGGPDLGM